MDFEMASGIIGQVGAAGEEIEVNMDTNEVGEQAPRGWVGRGVWHAGVW
jgi:hypothetical protein